MYIYRCPAAGFHLSRQLATETLEGRRALNSHDTATTVHGTSVDVTQTARVFLT